MQDREEKYQVVSLNCFLQFLQTCSFLFRVLVLHFLNCLGCLNNNAAAYEDFFVKSVFCLLVDDILCLSSLVFSLVDSCIFQYIFCQVYNTTLTILHDTNYHYMKCRFFLLYPICFLSKYLVFVKKVY